MAQQSTLVTMPGYMYVKGRGYVPVLPGDVVTHEGHYNVTIYPAPVKRELSPLEQWNQKMNRWEKLSWFIKMFISQPKPPTERKIKIQRYGKKKQSS